MTIRTASEETAATSQSLAQLAKSLNDSVFILKVKNHPSVYINGWLSFKTNKEWAYASNTTGSVCGVRYRE
jgi:hypothetical protein